MDIERVRGQLMMDEGVMYEVYLDHLGYPTCGIGHWITANDEEYDMPPGTPVSKARVFELFDIDLEQTIDECKALYGEWEFENFSDNVQEILVNMMFNLGRPRLSKFKKMNAAIADGDWDLAAFEGRDSLWYRQVPQRAERLMSRLESESAL